MSYLEELKKDAFDKATDPSSRAAIMEVLLFLHVIAIGAFWYFDKWVLLGIFFINSAFIFTQYYKYWVVPNKKPKVKVLDD